MGLLYNGHFDLHGRVCVSGQSQITQHVLGLISPSFGYDTGQISGFLAMPNFLERFGQFNHQTGNFYFSNVRSGLIVALVSFFGFRADCY